MDHRGGSRNERGRDLVVGSSGDLYLTGGTDSVDFPTVDPIQPNLSLLTCFCFDSFVTRVSADESSVLFSTYLGGALTDEGLAIGLDDNQNIYVAGDTRSEDFPTEVPIQATYGGGSTDVFIARIAGDGSQLLYTEIIETPSPTAGHGIAVASDNDVYVRGAQNVPADLYVGRFREGPMPSCPDFVDPPGVGVEDIALVAEHWDETPDSPTWDARFNFDEELRISIADVLNVSSYWGQECP